MARSSTVSGSFPIPAIAFGQKTLKSWTSWLFPMQVVNGLPRRIVVQDATERLAVFLVPVERGVGLIE